MYNEWQQQQKEKRRRRTPLLRNVSIVQQQAALLGRIHPSPLCMGSATSTTVLLELQAWNKIRFKNHLKNEPTLYIRGDIALAVHAEHQKLSGNHFQLLE